ncbi:hypothetical protein GCM10023339_39890 [Alloalcanivorax gelatiniphagus]
MTTGGPAPKAGDLLITRGRLLSLDDRLDETVQDVRLSGGRVVDVGPDLRTAGPEPAAVLDADGLTVVPLMDDTVLTAHPTEPGTPLPGSPGSPADLVLVRGPVTRWAALHQLVVGPPQLAGVLIGGTPVAAHGRMSVSSSAHAATVPDDDPRLGTWIDRTGYLEQTLVPDGRYHETRAGRPNAFTGAHWLFGSRVVYLDDTGFFAFGQVVGDVLHHAGYVMTKQLGA